MALMMEKKKFIAEESSKTRKAREKLKKQLAAVEKKITPQALEKKAIEIHRWIERHASSRVVLKSKSISLFDQNQNAAKLSSKVAAIAEQLKTETTNFWQADGKKRVVVQQGQLKSES